MPFQVPFGLPLDFQLFSKLPGIATPLAGFDPQDRQQQDMLTQMTMWAHMTEIMDIYCSVFEWKNLPPGCDERQLEWWLMSNGFVGFVYDEALAVAQPRQAPYGYGIMRLVVNGDLDMYNLPETYSAYSVAQGATNIPIDEGNAVIIFNDQLRVSPMPSIMLHAWRMTNIQRSLDSNIAQQKFANVVKGSPKQMRQLKQLMGATFAGVPFQFVDTDMETEIQQIPVAPDDRTASLTTAYENEWNAAKTFAGIESSRQKNERVFSTEAAANLAGADAFRFTRLVPRMKACRQINDLLRDHGWFDRIDPATGEPFQEVTVEFRGGAYVRETAEGTLPDEQAQTNAEIERDEDGTA